MITLQVIDGDLNLVGSSYVWLDGSNKLIQDLAFALEEEYGNDRFHPRWGSTLGEYVGTPQADIQKMLVQAEVERVVSNYMVIQRANLDRIVNMGGKPPFQSGEVIKSIDGVVITPSADTLNIQVNLTTVVGTSVTLQSSLSLLSGTLTGASA